jgi:hypothetical protein
VHVAFLRVREELRKLADDFGYWLAALGADPPLVAVASVIADTHHRFQWIHPFVDTNGRTGRVLDHFLLWSSFDLMSLSRETSPTIAYSPDEPHETDYYEGLLEADLGRPGRLRAYYAERIENAVAPLYTVHLWDGRKTTTCVGIHDDFERACDDARSRSRVIPERLFVVLGRTGLVARALSGELIDEGGKAVPPPSSDPRR